jgi:tetratricopeptide (TPR) repeat protein
MNPFLATFVAALITAQDPAPISVTTKEGKSATVQVVSLANGKVKLKITQIVGEMTVTRSLDDFEPLSAFMIEVRATDPKSYDQHFALAKRAAALDLLPQAGHQLRQAKKAAGSGADAETKVKALKAWAAGELERMVGVAVAAKDLEKASRCLDILATRLPEERTEEQLAKLAESVNALREQEADVRAAQAAAKRTKDQQTALQKKLEPIKSKNAKGDKELSRAISQSSNTVASVKSCESAVAAYKDAWKQAQEVLKQSEDDAEAQEEIAALTDHAADRAIAAALHAANMLVTQSDYSAATEWVNKILKFDPDNAEAKEMLTTIQLASAAASDKDDYRFGWRRGGRR